MRKKSLEGFVCRRCGFCCSLPGYVQLESGEAERIAAFLGMDVYQFTDRFTTLAYGRRKLSLTESEDGRCVFLQDDNTCRIQSVKPIQCVSFPFAWSSADLLEGCEGLRLLKAERDSAKTRITEETV